MRRARGKLCFGTLRDFSQNKAIKSLEEQVEGGKTDEDVRREIVALQKEIEKIVQEFVSMKIPLGRRISHFFGKAWKEREDGAYKPAAHSFNFLIDCRDPLGSFVLFVVNTARTHFSIVSFGAYFSGNSTSNP